MAHSSDYVFQMLSEAKEILKTISDAFGPEDFKTLHSKQQFEKLIVDPTEDTVKVGLMYLRWCERYPHRIGKDSEEETGCGDCHRQVCKLGFIQDDPTIDTWRPCHKLKPELHDKWQEESGYIYEN